MDNAFGVSHKVFEDKKFLKLSLPARILFTVLCKHSNYYADKDGWFWRSNDQLKKDCNMSLFSIKKAKNELKKAKFVRIIITTFSNDRQKKATIWRVKYFEDISKY